MTTSLAETASHAETGKEFLNIATVLEKIFPNTSFAHFIGRWENVFFSLLVAVLIVVTALWAAKKKNWVPAGLQNFCELIVETIDQFVTGILGAEGRKHVPFLGTIFIYILLMNWCGLIPFMKSATASWGITLSLALIVTVYVQITGVREQGFANYVKHMAGNPSNLFGLVLIPLMLVMNLVIEFFAVPLSLSLRLFANISSEDKLLYQFAELNVLFKGIPFLLQLFVNVLAIAFSVVQAFVFMLLSTVYISLMLPHDRHEHEETPIAHAR